MHHATQTLLIGIVNDLPGYPVAEQRQYLGQFNIPKIYEIGVHTFADAFRSARDGEVIAMAKGARALGDDHDTILAGLNLFKAAGVVLVDPACPEIRSSLDGDSAAMVRAALGNIHGEGHISKRARDMAVKAAKARSVKIRRARMGDEQAQIIWKRNAMTITAKLKRMHGWTRAQAYEAFGPSGGKMGRPKNPNKSVRT